MSMKKILAAAAASVVAVSAMSVVASAAGKITASFTDDEVIMDNDGNIQFNVSAMEEFDFLDAAGVTLIVTAEDPEEWIGGAVAFASDNFDHGANQKNWGSDDSQPFPMTSGEAFTISYGESPFTLDDTYAYIAIQAWGNTPVTLNYVEILDASGAVLASYGAKPDAAPPADETPSDETPNETPDDTSKPNTNTGVEGVAAVVGVAVVAAGAMVVAKKRK